MAAMRCTPAEITGCRGRRKKVKCSFNAGFRRAGRHDKRRKEVPMTETTRRNVEAAFVGEAKAYFRLLAFAGKADEEGYPQVARLFRSIAAAEAVHAKSHFELLEKVRSTEENLKLSFEKDDLRQRGGLPGVSETGLGRRGQALDLGTPRRPQRRGAPHPPLTSWPSPTWRATRRRSTSYAPTAGGSRPWRGPKNAPTAAGHRSSTTRFNRHKGLISE